MEEQIVKCLQNLVKQVHSQQILIVQLRDAVNNISRTGTGFVNRPVIVGVKDITTAQLIDAYQRKHLTIEQLVQLSDGKYTPQRHTFCTRLVENGVSCEMIKLLMGHSSVKTSMDIYTHISQQSMKKNMPNMTEILELID